MIIYYYPKVEDYDKLLFQRMYAIYKQLHYGERHVIEMDGFEDVEKAITVIKENMDKGGVIFSHFTNDYKKFIIFRTRDTDVWIKELSDKKKKDAEEK
jgi:hypothetical protein